MGGWLAEVPVLTMLDANGSPLQGYQASVRAVDPTSGEPLHLTIEDGSQVPPARGWAASASLSTSEGLLVGGLAGDDSSPVRLDDAWLLKVAEPMAYNRMT